MTLFYVTGLVLITLSLLSIGGVIRERRTPTRPKPSVDDCLTRRAAVYAGLSQGFKPSRGRAKEIVRSAGGVDPAATRAGLWHTISHLNP